jgi:hypothetical protein
VLDDVGQLVDQEPVAGLAVGGEGAEAEVEIGAEGEGAGMDAGGRGGRLAVGVDPDMREVVAEE